MPVAKPTTLAEVEAAGHTVDSDITELRQFRNKCDDRCCISTTPESNRSSLVLSISVPVFSCWWVRVVGVGWLRQARNGRQDRRSGLRASQATSCQLSAVDCRDKYEKSKGGNRGRSSTNALAHATTTPAPQTCAIGIPSPSPARKSAPAAPATPAIKREAPAARQHKRAEKQQWQHQRAARQQRQHQRA